MKKKILAMCLAVSMLGGASALAKEAPAELVPVEHGQCFTESDLFAKDIEGARGGFGVLYGDFSFRREQAMPGDAFREIGWMKLKPGASAGLHTHVDNEHAYIILAGEGVFMDGDDHAWIVKAGDMTMVRPGQSHGLANLGKEDLIFIETIAKNEDADLESFKKYVPQQYFAVSEQFDKSIEEAGGGDGILFGRFAFDRESADKNEAFKELACMRLEKGASIGLHKHDTDEAAYVILSGHGVFTDTNGKETCVSRRSILMAHPGESHALRNDGDEDLIFIEAIAQGGISENEASM